MAQKRKKRKNSRKWVSWVVFLVLFAVAGAVCYLVWETYFKEKADGGVGNEGVIEAVEKSEDKTGNITDGNDGAEVLEKEKVVQYEGSDPNAAEELTGVVTYAGVVESKLTVRVNIDQYLVEGKCNLVLIQDGAEAYGTSADIMASVATSTCDGFDVPLDMLGTGEYDIVINLISGGKTGVIKGGVKI